MSASPPFGPIRKAIFPVAGFGTRLLPATKAAPKEMLPVVDKPLIQYAVEEAREAGIEEFIFVTGRGKSIIEDHFDQTPELHTALTARGRSDSLAAINGSTLQPGQAAYVRQQQALGLGHAVWCARNLVGAEPVAILLSDDLIQAKTGCLKQMIDAWQHVGGTMAAVTEVGPDQLSSYGIVEPGEWDGRVLEIRSMVEKPAPEAAPSNIAVVGRFIVQPDLFTDLGRFQQGAGGEIQLTDALVRQIGHAPVNGFHFEGRRFDCGRAAGLLEANIAFALARDDLREGVRDMLKKFSD